MSELAHISSLLLRADPNKLATVCRQIESLPGGAVALTDPNGKIIVTLETGCEKEIVDHMNTLSLIDGVVSAALVYHETFHESAAH
ncbi:MULTISPECIES: chaperone NapD [Roseobacteraceae]|nr:MULTISPECIES: chaperone NapD [Roseobacteraceae]MBT3139699.1 chaperone NapD [Falsiruegeria litorea]MBT8169852.1 chaperone NapD [Falsiruegeria litorea]